MGIFKNKNSNLSCPLIHLEGLPLAAQTSCIISLTDDALIIETMNSKQRFELNISQVITIQQNANRQVTEKKKSVVKRGIAGNMLFGSTGAVVGGLSGLGTKEISQLVYDLTIVYTTNTNETNTLIFRSLNHNVCNNIIDSVKNNLLKNCNFSLFVVITRFYWYSSVLGIFLRPYKTISDLTR